MFADNDDKAVRPVVVAIPARDEADTIARCLQALCRQTCYPTGVVLLLNNCVDETEHIARSIALPFRLSIRSVWLSPPEANAGTARRLAMEYAAHIAGQTGVVMTTDADAVVPSDWIAANMRAMGSGVDVVCGRAVIDPDDAAQIPLHLHADDALECEYAELLDAITEKLCPDPVDPRPRHVEASGASLAMSVVAFRNAGGVPRVSTGEDRALIDALRRIDARIRHDPAIRVVVSGRTQGRAIGGMADTIRRRMIHQDVFTDASFEPPHDAYRRADFRRRLRTMWAGAPDATLAMDLQLPNDALNGSLREEFFGQLWGEVESRSPALRRRRRVRFSDLRQYIILARGLLSSVQIDPVPDHQAAE